MIAVLERSLDKPMNTEMAEETLRAIQLLKDKLKNRNHEKICKTL